uniref:TFIIS N-terminal domain-containing protein n=1 Tax=Globisporangium ultimum (strain ATCC 200006 / CBS 805.95 / DAOM BR144) TaxID=431595 RepID=K3W5Y5_GLOUD
MDRVKSLESMNRVLEQPDEQEGGAEKSSHLAVLEKLHGMTLTTQEIIASKIGVVVSKLRKSSNEKVAKAAILLRKKWKTEAARA